MIKKGNLSSAGVPLLRPYLTSSKRGHSCGTVLDFHLLPDNEGCSHHNLGACLIQ